MGRAAAEAGELPRSARRCGSLSLAADTVAVHEAYERGDVAALKAALGDPPDFPNGRNPPGVEAGCLEYAIYHSPLALIRALLELGAEPNYPDAAGFPCLIAALSSGRRDRLAIVGLLLAHGADVEQRGINDYTPLHYAAAADDPQAIELLLARGADPGARTRIDDRATPLQEAQTLGRKAAAEALERLAPPKSPDAGLSPALACGLD